MHSFPQTSPTSVLDPNFEILFSNLFNLFSFPKVRDETLHLYVSGQNYVNFVF